MGRHVGLNPRERIVTVGNGHVAQVEPAVVDPPVRQTDHDEGQAGQGLPRPDLRDRGTFVEGDLHRADALGRDVALQLGEQSFGAEGFEDRETLPSPQWRIPE
jgi:hypothetical protein